MSSHQIAEKGSDKGVFSRWWFYLAYHHKWAEGMLYLMFISGLLLWDRLDVGWQVERITLLLHMLIGLTLFVVIMAPFWLAHRRLISGSKKAFLRKTGSIIEWLLVVCTSTGFYLFFFGIPGNTMGNLMADVHFYSSWLLAPLVFRHAMRWSVLKIIKNK
ncbi:hypothetical protein [Vibrio sp. F74]|uniref:hypothetical protein n=1 Tax=Vibrio sp. F74 TaxID=700020 RepID=UPI0035F5983D